MEIHDLGKKGEIVAANYLVSLGYEVLDKNYFNKNGYRKGEIDIIAKDKNGKLVFVEVKTRKGDRKKIIPEESITPVKIKKIIKAVNYFLYGRGWQGYDWRIDSISVIFDFKERKMNIRHIKAIRL